jgi:hypothetical protein
MCELDSKKKQTDIASHCIVETLILALKLKFIFKVIFYSVYIYWGSVQKEVISDLKAENQFLSK